jgi:NitT/TauT family transport system substrate-binding protein
MQARKAPGASLVFDSSMIPGEILDLMVVKTAAPDTLKKALAGAWYEVMGILATPGPARDAAVAWMAESAGGSVEDFEAQLKTTAMYYTPAEAVAFATSADIKATMERVRQFTYAKGLFGQGAASADVVGIAFPDGTVQGDPANVKLRYTSTWMQAAADGSL